MKDKGWTRVRSCPSLETKGHRTVKCNVWPLIESCAEFFSFPIKDISEMVIKTNKVCRLDNSIVIIVNFHSFTVLPCLCKRMSSFLGNRLGRCKGHGSWIDCKGAQRNCLGWQGALTLDWVVGYKSIYIYWNFLNCTLNICAFSHM